MSPINTLSFLKYAQYVSVSLLMVKIVLLLRLFVCVCVFFFFLVFFYIFYSLHWFDCHANIPPITGLENNLVQPKIDQWLSSPSHFSSFFTVTVVQMSFCSLIKGITPKVRTLCFVVVNSVRLNLLCVWIQSSLVQIMGAR